MRNVEASKGVSAPKAPRACIRAAKRSMETCGAGRAGAHPYLRRRCGSVRSFLRRILTIEDLAINIHTSPLARRRRRPYHPYHRYGIAHSDHQTKGGFFAQTLSILPRSGSNPRLLCLTNDCLGQQRTVISDRALSVIGYFHAHGSEIRTGPPACRESMGVSPLAYSARDTAPRGVSSLCIDATRTPRKNLYQFLR